MKTTRLITILVGLATIVLISADASAYYHPTMGRFMQRDPGPGAAVRLGTAGPVIMGSFTNRDPVSQYVDGMSLYQYVRSQPVGLVDPTGLVGDDLQLINYLVKKYGLSKAGRELLHGELKALKGVGGLAAKGEADLLAADIAGMGGKYIARGLGILFIVLTLEGEANAAEVPWGPEEIAAYIASQECAECTCEKVIETRMENKKYWATKDWFGLSVAEGSYWDLVEADITSLGEKRKFGIMTREKCVQKCQKLPSTEWRTIKDTLNIRVKEREYWR